MVTRLNIGPEAEPEPSETDLKASPYLLNLSRLDSEKKPPKNGKTIDVPLLKGQAQNPGRICIVGERRSPSQFKRHVGLVATAVVLIFAINFAQLAFRFDQQKNDSLAMAGEIFEDFQEGIVQLSSSELGVDQNPFESALNQIQTLEHDLGALTFSGSEHWPKPQIGENVQALFGLAEELSTLGSLAVSLKEELTHPPEVGSLTEWLQGVSQTEGELLLQHIQSAEAYLKRIDWTGLPYEQQFKEVQSALLDLFESSQFWWDHEDELLRALGHEHPQLYLVLFQNEGELHPAGGFIGSLAFLQINDGRIDRLEFSDVYDWVNTYDPSPHPIPELEPYSAFWWLGDAGVSPDFPASAEHAIRLLDEAGGPGVDGVIAVTTETARAVLGELGPIQLSSLPAPIEGEAFVEVVSPLVEAKVFGTEEPKALLKELLDLSFERLKEPELQIKVAQALLSQAENKQLSIYHRDPEVQAWLTQLGVSSDLPKLGEEKGDFLLPVFMNLGDKTRHFIHADIDHQTTILNDGSQVVALTITQSNRFDQATLDRYKALSAEQGFTAWTPELEATIGNRTHTSLMRIYAPEGLRLLDVQGDLYRDELKFNYDMAQDLSYYSLSQSLNPGETKQFTLVYELPEQFKSDLETYSFQLFKQPGLKNVTFSKSVQSLEGDWLTSSSNYPIQKEPQTLQIEGDLGQDLWLTGLLE